MLGGGYSRRLERAAGLLVLTGTLAGGSAAGWAQSIFVPPPPPPPTPTAPPPPVVTVTPEIVVVQPTTQDNSFRQDTIRSLARGTIGTLRSQANATTDGVFDRLRSVTRGLAASATGGTGPTPPGGTVTLEEFSSIQPFDYAGLAAGSPGTRWGLWGDASGSFLRNNTPVGFDGTSELALTGLDYLADANWVFGLTSGYTHADLSLTPSSVRRSVNGAVVGPYAAYVINPNVAIDALVNYTSLDNRLAAPAPLAGGGYHSNRVTGATELDFFGDYGGMKLTGFGGYAFSWEGGNPGAIVGNALANNVRYGAIRVGGEAAYPVGAFEPYVPLTFEYETTNPNDGTSRTALVVGAGLRYRWSETLTGGLLAETTEVKTHARDIRVGANVRWSF